MLSGLSPGKFVAIRATLVVLGLVLIAEVGLVKLAIGSTAELLVPPPPPPRAAPAAPRVSIEETLLAQAENLIDGNEVGWLAPVDQSDAKLLQQYRQLYDRLRPLGPVRLVPVIEEGRNHPVDHATVVYFVCVQVTTCADDGPPPIANANLFLQTETIEAKITWTSFGMGPTITGFTLTPESRFPRAQPAFYTPMRTMSGQRSTVFAAADLAGNLRTAVTAADRAAKVADRYAHWVRPNRYIVYLADAKQWRTWYGGRVDATSVLAYAILSSRSSDIVVVNWDLAQRETLPLEDLLRHEFGHVVTMLGRPVPGDDDVLTEGIAEYIREDGRPLSHFDRLASVGDYLRSHAWNGDPTVLDSKIGDVNLADAAYGIGFLFWRCIASHYGSAKLFEFVGATVHNRPTSLDAAARSALGDAWTKVTAGCAPYVRNAVF
jgi:hypothetical protein